MLCPNCGAKAAPGETRCRTCGNALITSTTARSVPKDSRQDGSSRPPTSKASRNSWIRLALLAVYLIVGTWIVGGLLEGRPTMAVLGLVSLFGVLLATNAWRLRSRVPPFSSSNRVSASAGWAGLGMVALAAFVLTYGSGTEPPQNPTTQAAVTEPSAPSSASSTPRLSTATAVPPTPTPTPSPKPTPTPTPTPAPPPPPPTPPAPPPPPPAANTCGAPANPWGYNFCGGNLIYSPPSDFCGYFNCIPSFWQHTLGYVDECQDGTYSHSGGRSGACSYHGGELRPLYSP